MLETPIGKAGVRGDERQKGQVSPTVAQHEVHGRDAQRDVGGKCEGDVARLRIMNERHVRGVVGAGHGKHRHQLGLPARGQHNDKYRPSCQHGSRSYRAVDHP